MRVFSRNDIHSSDPSHHSMNMITSMPVYIGAPTLIFQLIHARFNNSSLGAKNVTGEGIKLSATGIVVLKRGTWPSKSIFGDQTT